MKCEKCGIGSLRRMPFALLNVKNALICDNCFSIFIEEAGTIKFAEQLTEFWAESLRKLSNGANKEEQLEEIKKLPLFE